MCPLSPDSLQALFNTPLTYDDTARDRMDTHVPMNSFLLVHDALKTRDFELYAEPVFVVASQLP